MITHWTFSNTFITLSECFHAINIPYNNNFAAWIGNSIVFLFCFVLFFFFLNKNKSIFLGSIRRHIPWWGRKYKVICVYAESFNNLSGHRITSVALNFSMIIPFFIKGVYWRFFYKYFSIISLYLIKKIK